MQVFEVSDYKIYNDFLLLNNGPLLQSWEWGEFQKKMGRRVWRLQLSTNVGKILAEATIVKMPLPQGKSYFYCPRGPVFAASLNFDRVWQLFLDKISDLTVSEKPIFFRVDPEIITGDSNFFLPRNFKKVPWEIQPKETLVLDLRQSEQQLLHAMKPKTRYNIHLAEKKGVSVDEYQDGAKAKIFWDLLKQTTARDGFSGHPYLYYFNLLEVLGKAGIIRLLVANYQRRPISAAIISLFSGRAVYLHGASSDRLRGVMAPYLVQWSAIRSAKTAGAATYDFAGIAPKSAKASHAWAGISRFKRGFGGKEISYIGAYDLVFVNFWYGLYRLVRKFRHF